MEWEGRCGVWSGRGDVVCGVGGEVWCVEWEGRCGVWSGRPGRCRVYLVCVCVCVCVCVTPLSFRRLRFTSDPLQANKLVTVNLPVLSLHLDEDKASLLVDAGRLCPAPTVISL